MVNIVPKARYYFTYICGISLLFLGLFSLVLLAKMLNTIFIKINKMITPGSNKRPWMSNKTPRVRLSSTSSAAR